MGTLDMVIGLDTLDMLPHMLHMPTPHTHTTVFTRSHMVLLSTRLLLLLKKKLKKRMLQLKKLPGRREAFSLHPTMDLDTSDMLTTLMLPQPHLSPTATLQLFQ